MLKPYNLPTHTTKELKDIMTRTPVKQKHINIFFKTTTCISYVRNRLQFHYEVRYITTTFLGSKYFFSKYSSLKPKASLLILPNNVATERIQF